MSRPCPQCDCLKKGAFYKNKGTWICEDCEERVIKAELGAKRPVGDSKKKRYG